MLIEETNVPDAALPVDALKAHLRLGSGFGQDTVQDGVLAGFLRAALAAVEARTGKALMAREFTQSVGELRGAEALNLAVAPVTVIASVTLVSRDGAEQTVSPDIYWLERDGHTPKLRAAAACLPGPERGGALRVRFLAGFGAEFDDLPADLRQAVLMLAAHYYEYRHDTALSDGCMPFGVSSLIERFRNLRIGLSGART
ncbi:head-tail connector protein [Sulfitobacter albidus]|uniref:Head-tail connector protein n=2 Tax=Sulfitobacter albidus TaxID=2829501 RepID=A0A975JG86_9RHOB|nr:head-tail connector protein [Sulfitobacter albidus]